MVVNVRFGEFTAARAPAVDPGLAALTLVASHYRVAADPYQLSHELGLAGRPGGAEDVVRAALRIGLKAKLVRTHSMRRVSAAPTPAILPLKDGVFAIFIGCLPDGRFRLVDPVSQTAREEEADAVAQVWPGDLILVTRRAGGPGADPRTIGFWWFLPSIWRHRKSLIHVLAASLFLQAFAMATPLFFQLVIDKVLLHRAFSTLSVVIAGLLAIGLFDVTLQYLRSYALNHTTSRIDVELGARLFDHLFRLPLAYFETRAAGQTVARMREIEIDPHVLDRAGAVFCNRPAFCAGSGLGPVHLLTSVDAHRAWLHPVLLDYCRGVSSPSQGKDERALQPGRREPAVPR